MSKIEKTIARQKQKIAEGQYYEAHQQLRVIASRYVKQNDTNSAVDILSSGATLLLGAGQAGSGGDLALFLLEVYNKASLTPQPATKARLLSILRAFPPGEPTKKRYVNEMINWSIKHGDMPRGDPEIHHVAGSIFADEKEPYEAEKHLVLGTKDSPDVLVKLEYLWYTEDEPHTAPLYAARAVLPYLLVGNVRAAHKSLLLFRSKLEGQGGNNAGLGVQEVSSSISDLRVYPSMPLLNFLGMLLLAVQRGAADLFRQLKSHYSKDLDDVPQWEDALVQIGEMYFGIKMQAMTNPLFDMMSSMMMGRGGGGAGPKRGGPRAGMPAFD